MRIIYTSIPQGVLDDRRLCSMPGLSDMHPLRACWLANLNKWHRRKKVWLDNQAKCTRQELEEETEGSINLNFFSQHKAVNVLSRVRLWDFAHVHSHTLASEDATHEHCHFTHLIMPRPLIAIAVQSRACFQSLFLQPFRNLIKGSLPKKQMFFAWIRLFQTYRYQYIYWSILSFSRSSRSDSASVGMTI